MHRIPLLLAVGMSLGLATLAGCTPLPADDEYPSCRDLDEFEPDTYLYGLAVDATPEHEFSGQDYVLEVTVAMQSGMANGLRLTYQSDVLGANSLESGLVAAGSEAWCLVPTAGPAGLAVQFEVGCELSDGETIKQRIDLRLRTPRFPVGEDDFEEVDLAYVRG